MTLDLTWLLWGLPLAFGLGWLASRLDVRQLKLQHHTAPKAYFKGLNFLLNEQQDQAIDTFIEAVQNDPDTSELHFALGNLFRRRGEYNRAVRVHEHLLARADLSKTDRQRAQHALALDFLKAGLLDRSEKAFAQLDGTPFENQARLARMAIYERSRDWSHAATVAQQLHDSGEADFSVRLAHYLCEQATQRVQAGDRAGAEALLRQAVARAPQAPRPRLALAQWLAADHTEEAHSLWLAAAQQTPQALPLMATDWAHCAQRIGATDATRQVLEARYAAQPSLDVLEALIALDGGAEQPAARARYLQHLQKQPSLSAATRWLAGDAVAQQQPDVQRALDTAARPLARYRCASCGFEAKTHFWHCPGCQTWDSYPPQRIEEL